MEHRTYSKNVHTGGCERHSEYPASQNTTIRFLGVGMGEIRAVHSPVCLQGAKRKALQRPGRTEQFVWRPGHLEEALETECATKNKGVLVEGA